MADVGDQPPSADVDALRRTIEELRDSRARLVETARSDRLRLERDLHDGAQQRLFAIQIKLDAARERAAGNEALVHELEELSADVAAAVDDLRALAYGLYPVVLHERGLAGALRALSYEAAIPVEVVDRETPRCSPAVEDAVYFAAAEAIQNAAEHAGPGARVTVTLEPGSAELTFAVEDDGPGFDVERQGDGRGITSMRDRIAAVAGEFEIVSEPGGGTTVRGRVPSGKSSGVAASPGSHDAS